MSEYVFYCMVGVVAAGGFLFVVLPLTVYLCAKAAAVGRIQGEEFYFRCLDDMIQKKEGKDEQARP